MTTLRSSWNRFWFTPTPTSTLAAVRIAYGILLLAWSLTLWPHLDAFFSPSGLVPDRPEGEWTWSLLDVFPSDAAVGALFGLLVVSAACVALGFHSRLATVVALVALTSFQRRNPFILNGGDGLLRMLGFYLVLAPSGAALSLDRWRKARHRFWAFPSRAPWALRLIQVQVSVLYLSSVWEKLRGTTWNSGTAVSYAMRVDELARFSPPSFLTESILVSSLLTFGTLVLELTLGALVWNRRLRPWVLAAGVLLHVSIDLTMRLGFFSWTMFVGYLAFIPGDALSRRLLAGRERMPRFLSRELQGSAHPGPPDADPNPSTGGPKMKNKPTTSNRRLRLLAAALATGATLFVAVPSAVADAHGPSVDDVITLDDADGIDADGIDADGTDADGTDSPDFTADEGGDDTDGDSPDFTADEGGDDSDGNDSPDFTADDGDGSTDGNDSGDGSADGSSDGSSADGIPVPKRIDTGAGGSADGGSALGTYIVVGTALVLAAAAVGRRSIARLGWAGGLK